ncbi:MULTISPECIES: glycosyltransferase family 4 protein [unclassified Coleofasciculus]|uniref:glycosyltransferase family 4 protein n=1 Tax=unclassified Coleofasciculus TaxID=2692782 RepID=UPI00187E0CB2|nr:MULTISPECIES: glycosyltransferase family 1 protein [unclassified Coleofasciculus]
MIADSDWLGGVIYVQNLACAIAHLPALERSNITLSLTVRASHSNLVDHTVRPYVDQVKVRHFWDLAYLKIYHLLSEYLTFIPLNILNPQKVDFLYPNLDGRRYPYCWGGWIPDFQHYHLPHLFTKEEIAYRNQQHQKIADAAPVVILSSQMAQQDFNNFYPEAASRSRVMHFVSSPELEWFQLDPKGVQHKYKLPDFFFLVSNQFWQHKDHAVVIEALGLLKQTGIKPTVVCTGNTTDNRNTKYYNQLIIRIKELELGDQVKILGLIPRLDQIQLMRRCLAVIQPSLFEGWSTVVEDARTLGKPMLISDFPVHLEQAPLDSLFFEMHNYEQLARLISQAFLTLNPGPDIENEILARQDNVERVIKYGRRFLEIVNGVVNGS